MLSGKADPDWTPSMESSGLESVHTAHPPGLKADGVNAEGLNGECPTLGASAGKMNLRLERIQKTKGFPLLQKIFLKRR